VRSQRSGHIQESASALLVVIVNSARDRSDHAMSDSLTKPQRSKLMGLVKGTGNKRTEVAFMLLMRGNGITGWRRHQRVFGKPDFVFRRAKVAVFVDGCFWHGCPTHGSIPVSNVHFWRSKLDGNIARDALVGRELRQHGWRVFRVWEHELPSKNERRLVRRLRMALGDMPNRR